MDEETKRMDIVYFGRSDRTPESLLALTGGAAITVRHTGGSRCGFLMDSRASHHRLQTSLKSRETVLIQDQQRQYHFRPRTRDLRSQGAS